MGYTDNFTTSLPQNTSFVAVIVVVCAVMVSFHGGCNSGSQHRSPGSSTCPVFILFYKFNFRQCSMHFLTFKRGFFQTLPLYCKKEKEASWVEDQQNESSTMVTPEGQRRQRRFAVTSNNNLLLLEGISLWVSSYFLMQSGPHIYIKN